MKPLTCGIHSTNLMIHLCTIRLYQISCNYWLLEIISISVIGILTKSYISATLTRTHAHTSQVKTAGIICILRE